MGTRKKCDTVTHGDVLAPVAADQARQTRPVVMPDIMLRSFVSYAFIFLTMIIAALPVSCVFMQNKVALLC